MKETELPIIKGISSGGRLRREAANAISEYERKGSAQKGECTLGAFLLGAAEAAGAEAGGGGWDPTTDLLPLLNIAGATGGTATLVDGVLTVTHVAAATVTIPLVAPIALSEGNAMFAQRGAGGAFSATVRLGDADVGIIVGMTGPGAAGGGVKSGGSHTATSITLGAGGGGTTMNVRRLRLWQ